MQKLQDYILGFFNISQSMVMIGNLGCAKLVFARFDIDLMYASVFITEEKSMDMVYFFADRLSNEGFNVDILPL